jgi:hypothetical protein
MKTLKNTASLIKTTTLQDSDFVKQNAASTNYQTPPLIYPNKPRLLPGSEIHGPNLGIFEKGTVEGKILGMNMLCPGLITNQVMYDPINNLHLLGSTRNGDN